jgi:type I restriction enzyme R subunit
VYGFDDLYIHFDVEKALKLLAEVNNRIATINFKQQIERVDDVSSVLNTAMDQIDFQFRKIKDEELVIADTFRDSLEKTRREIVERNLDPKDPEYVGLLDELKRVFKKKNIEELTADEMKELTAELEDLRKRAERKNHADRMLCAKYNGDAKFMRTHKRLMGYSSALANDVVTHKILMKIKEKTDEQIAHNQNVLDNEPFFKLSLQPNIVNACKEQNVSVDINQMSFIDNCIAQEYFFERNWTA